MFKLICQKTRTVETYFETTNKKLLITTIKFQLIIADDHYFMVTELRLKAIKHANNFFFSNLLITRYIPIPIKPETRKGLKN